MVSYRSIVIPPIAYAQQIIDRKCQIHAIITTSLGAVGFQYTIFDGYSAGTNVLWQGDDMRVSQSQLHIPVSNGIFFESSGGATQAGMVIVIAIDSDDE